MAVRPSKLSQTPIRLELAEGRGDVLGDVLSLGFLRNVLYKRLDARAPWGMHVPERSRATLYLIARGQARLELESQEPLVLAEGHVAFLPRGAAHVLRDSSTTAPSPVCDGGRPRPRPGPTVGTRRIGGQGELTSILAAFSELDRAPPPLLGQPGEVVILSGASSSSDPLVSATIALVLAELERPGPASVVMLERLADVLVVHAMRALTRQHSCRARRQEGLVALSDPPIHRALSLMHAQVGRAWTVAELAARVGLSRSGFAARFTELVGDPPLQYLAHWRATRAAELLRGTDQAVSAIAASVGYDSTPSFNKAFKRRHGISPGAYRRAALTPR
jgi:AraC-like DNA-binding protein